MGKQEVVAILGGRSDAVRLSQVIGNLAGHVGVLCLGEGHGKLHETKMADTWGASAGRGHPQASPNPVDIAIVESELRERHARLVVTVGSGPAAKAGSEGARACRIPVVHVDALAQELSYVKQEPDDVYCVSSSRFFGSAVAAGVPRDRILMAGSTYPEVISASLRHATSLPRHLRNPYLSNANTSEKFLLVAPSSPAAANMLSGPGLVRDLVAQAASTIIVASESVTKGVGRVLIPKDAPVTMLPILPHHQFVSLLASADQIVTDSEAIAEEASWAQSQADGASAQSPHTRRDAKVYRVDRVDKRLIPIPLRRRGGDGLASDRISLLIELMLAGQTSPQAVCAAEEAFGTAWEKPLTQRRLLSAQHMMSSSDPTPRVQTQVVEF